MTSRKQSGWRNSARKNASSGELNIYGSTGFSVSLFPIYSLFSLNLVVVVVVAVMAPLQSIRHTYGARGFLISHSLVRGFHESPLMFVDGTLERGGK